MRPRSTPHVSLDGHYSLPCCTSVDEFIDLSRTDLDIQDKRRFDKRFSNQVPSKFPKARNEKTARPKVKKEMIGSSCIEKASSKECGKNNFCACLLGSDKYFCCGKLGHKVRDCPNAKGQ